MATNLQFIKSIKITTEQSTTSVTNVFSDAYSVYEIYADGISTVGTNQSDLNMRFIDSSDNVYQIMNMIMHINNEGWYNI